jgi:hypothetical protein
LAKLSAAQSQVKQWDGAVENLRESLRIMRSAVGNEHVMVAQTLSQMACSILAGELLAAQATFNDALSNCAGTTTVGITGSGTKWQYQQQQYQQQLFTFRSAIKTCCGLKFPN